MEETKVAAVVPTCRTYTIPPQNIPVHWYVVHDMTRREVQNDVGAEVSHIVGPDASMFGNRSDSIRSAGFMQAYKDGYDYILTVDDDCFVPLDWAQSHVLALMWDEPIWWRTIGYETRGFPDDPEEKPVGISHGIWDGVQDWSGKQQKSGRQLMRHSGKWRRIGFPFPQSSMNLGFRRECAGIMYQPAQGPDEGIDRFADIWCGLFAQRVLDLHGWAAMNGGAVVYHRRASDLETNLRKEAAGAEIHEKLWRHVWAFDRTGPGIDDTYSLLAEHISHYPHDYLKRTAERMHRWQTLLAR